MGHTTMMATGWTAVDGVADRLPRARLLQRAYAQVVGSADPSALRSEASNLVRPVVLASWRRSQESGVDAVSLPPVVFDAEAVGQQLDRHPLGGAVELLESAVGAVANAGQVLVLADPDGLVLWVDGNAAMLANARDVHLGPGAVWSEKASGTNALGSALALNHPLQVFSAEHFKRSLHRWSSSAAPVRSGDGPEVVGAVAVWGPFEAAHPHGLSLVAALARLLEVHLRDAMMARDQRLELEYLEHVTSSRAQRSAVVTPEGRVLRSTPAGWLGRRMQLSTHGVPLAPRGERLVIDPVGDDDGFLVLDAPGRERREPKPRLVLRALGRNRALVSLQGRRYELTPRQSDIVVILALNPSGLSEASLSTALYPSPGETVTVRAAVCRLRKLLGPVITGQPYRLDARVDADFLRQRRLADSDRQVAIARPRGALLPASQAPAVVLERTRIEQP
jgi:hypothetical protein